MQDIYKHYTYVYLDPSKPGPFSYSEMSFTHEPFYIGKGRNKRCYQHLKRMDKHPMTDRIQELKRNNFKPFIIILEKFKDERECLSFEHKLINEIGCRYIQTGPLCNQTIGRGGRSNVNMSGDKNSMFGKKQKPESNVRNRLNQPTRKELTVDGVIYCSIYEAMRATCLPKNTLQKHCIKRGINDLQTLIELTKNNKANREIMLDGLKYKSIHIAEQIIGMSKHLIRKMLNDPQMENCYRL
jgi:hypothetical protein